MARQDKMTKIEAGAQDAFGAGAGSEPPRVTRPEKGLKRESTAPPGVDSSAPQEVTQADCDNFRPTSRPPIGLLHILDDGSTTSGECVRIRANETVIGRAEGDILICHDSAISSRHAEIVRETDRGKYRWLLRDLGSRNGTFVRVAKVLLKQEQELILGSRRYAFRLPKQGLPEAVAHTPGKDRQVTQGWQIVTPESLNEQHAALVELLPSGEQGSIITLDGDVVRLGSSESNCTHPIQGDPYVSSVHAVISQQQGNRWTLTDDRSVNGVWMKIKSVPLDSVCDFQLGEQRFRFRPMT